jgi:hypothetical protein
VKPLLSVVTPCCRPNLLPQVEASFSVVRPYFDVRWLVCVDTSLTCVEQVTVRPHVCIGCGESTRGGNEQRNALLPLVEDGWLYFLDDDNLFHPDFGEAAIAAVREHDAATAFCFWQDRADGTPYTRATSVVFRGIDTGAVLLHTSAVGETRWNPGRECDYAFFKDIEDKPTEFVFVPRVAAYYNAIR